MKPPGANYRSYGMKLIIKVPTNNINPLKSLPVKTIVLSNI